MSIVKTLSVQRTVYHKVVMHYLEKDDGVYVVKVTPDIGPLPDLQSLVDVRFIDVSKARTAVRAAMKVKEGRDLSHLRVKPQKWVEFVLALDEFLVSVGLGFDDLTNQDYPELRACQKKEGDVSVTYLMGKWVNDDKEFSHNFGKIDWTTHVVN